MPTARFQPAIPAVDLRLKHRGHWESPNLYAGYFKAAVGRLHYTQCRIVR